MTDDGTHTSRAKRVLHRLPRWHRAPLFSPTGFLVRAAILSLVYLVLHAAGLRSCVSILSGSAASGSLPTSVSGALGIIYVCFYFAFVLFVPILIIAAGVMAAGARLWRGERSPSASAEPGPSSRG